MRVRSSSSCVHTWPDVNAVHRALVGWAQELAQQHSDVRSVGYFGSYARGDWGVGSDLDVLLVVRSTDLPVERRAAAWDTTTLPVPVDLLVYTDAEWAALSQTGRFGETVRREAVWVYQQASAQHQSDRPR
jgi:uncharacterized protein